jgi:predicted transcriptional regulator
MVETTIKDKVLKALEEMPQNVTFEEIMERLYFLYKIDQGLKQVEAGDTISHEDAKKQIKTWHK